MTMQLNPEPTPNNKSTPEPDVTLELLGLFTPPAGGPTATTSEDVTQLLVDILADIEAESSSNQAN